MRSTFFPQPHNEIEGPHLIPHIKKIEDPHLKPRKKSEVRSDLRTSPHLSQMSEKWLYHSKKKRNFAIVIIATLA